MATITIVDAIAGYGTLIKAAMFALTAICLLSVVMWIVALTLTSTKALIPIDQNVTTIEKTNQLWPIKGAISMDGCHHKSCFDI